MSRPSRLARPRVPYRPRARGDEPDLLYVDDQAELSAPRRRGWWWLGDEDAERVAGWVGVDPEWFFWVVSAILE